MWSVKLRDRKDAESKMKIIVGMNEAWGKEKKTHPEISHRPRAYKNSICCSLSDFMLKWVVYWDISSITQNCYCLVLKIIFDFTFFPFFLFCQERFQFLRLQTRSNPRYSGLIFGERCFLFCLFTKVKCSFAITIQDHRWCCHCNARSQLTIKRCHGVVCRNIKRRNNKRKGFSAIIH